MDCVLSNKVHIACLWTDPQGEVHKFAEKRFHWGLVGVSLIGAVELWEQSSQFLTWLCCLFLSVMPQNP